MFTAGPAFFVVAAASSGTVVSTSGMDVGYAGQPFVIATMGTVPTTGLDVAKDGQPFVIR